MPLLVAAGSGHVNDVLSGLGESDWWVVRREVTEAVGLPFQEQDFLPLLKRVVENGEAAWLFLPPWAAGRVSPA
jgi:hypothetical protein